MEMGAQNWLLRATRDKADYLDLTGRSPEGHACLTEVYNSFSEGFGCPKMRETEKQLQHLAGLAASHSEIARA